MPKPNAFIMARVEEEIQRRVKRGELMTPRQNFANMSLLTEMMTVAVNRGLGIGKIRFQRDVQPILDQLLDEFFVNKETADEEYAASVIARLYSEIMD